jgi:uncharacterized protein
MKIKRAIELQVKKNLVPGKIVMILGARRVGKTTLIKDVIKNLSGVDFYNCDDPDVRAKFTDISLTSLKSLFKDVKIVVFDEAQRIKNIGITLKMIVDEMPLKKVLVSGSSSLELSNKIREPLTGRKKTFNLFPLSFFELYAHENKNKIAVEAYLEQAMRFGLYPECFNKPKDSEKQDYLQELAGDYLYKDALEYQEVRNPEQLRKLLQVLALQIGNEVSFPELASVAGLDQKTVMRYLDLLEKSFVVFRLPAFSRNLRKEISKSRKIYFYDLGIRNALIRNFNSYDLRNDKGQAWENLLVLERIKRDSYLGEKKNYYFWRTYEQKEIDFIEDYSGKIKAFEFKWKEANFKKSQEFLSAYPESSLKLINKDNFLDFVT